MEAALHFSFDLKKGKKWFYMKEIRYVFNCNAIAQMTLKFNQNDNNCNE